MKKLKLLSFIGLALAFVLSSCSMEKRVYMSGYNIEWKNNKSNGNKQDLVRNNANNEVKSDNQNNINTRAKNDSSETSVVDNSELKEENNITASTDNSVFILSPQKFDLNKKSNKIVASKGNSTSETKEIIREQKKKQNKKEAKQNAGSGGGKSQIVALILCIFLGLLGVHRFYLGYAGLGILYLLTGGLFGIGWLIDLILLIIPNGLTPKGKSNYRE